MSIARLSGKAQTVLGPVDAANLGIALAHEHLILDLSFSFVEPSSESDRMLAYQPLCLDNLGWIHNHAGSSLDNLRLQDETVAAGELIRFKNAGGSTIVELTNTGFGRNPLALRRIAESTGVNIIMGSGYYTGKSHPAALAARTEEEIADEIVSDIMRGVGDTGVCAGIIGEIGCSYPLMDTERKVLRAAARAQRCTGAPLNIHPGFPYRESPFEIAGVLAEAGAELSRTVFSHLDGCFIDVKGLAELAKKGCYIEYDLFGRLGRIIHPVEFIDIPSEGERIETLKQLIELGYLDRLLISHDICFKMRLYRYGGHGYAHILKYIVPLMRHKGIPEEHIQAILVRNPARLLEFV